MKKKILQLFNQFALKFGYRLSTAKVHVSPSADLLPVMAILKAQKGTGLTVVQVGANDGKTHDPIFEGVQKFADKVLLVEPLIELIPSLKENYENFKGEKIIEAVAIATEIGTLPFYRVNSTIRNRLLKAGNDPNLYASFDKAHVRHHLINGPIKIEKDQADKYLEKLLLPTSTLKDLFAKHQIGQVDLLQIDCEGYDWKVLSTIGSAIRPSVINLEYKHLTEVDRKALVSWLDGENYQWMIHNRDCFAFKL
jgi:FkbM family methyltransferase